MITETLLQERITKLKEDLQTCKNSVLFALATQAKIEELEKVLNHE